MLLAHISKEENGKRVEQTLVSHCRNTAKYAAECLEGTGLSSTGFLAGMIHDMGKAKIEYQDYLEEAFAGKNPKRGSVNHTFAAVIYLFERHHTHSKRDLTSLTCELISYAAGAHHGEFDCVNLDGCNGFEHRIHSDPESIYYAESKERFLKECFDEEELDKYFLLAEEEIQKSYESLLKAAEIIDINIRGKVLNFWLGMMARLLLSAVIYGDRRDTGEFMGGRQIEKSCGDSSLWKSQLEFLEKELQELSSARKSCGEKEKDSLSSESAINRARQKISDQCKEAAERSNGIYRVNVPTGGGKTLATLRFALAHAERYNKKRIIILTPLLTILDQNSKVIRKYLKNPEIILEHHSEVLKSEMSKEQLDEYELLTTDWNAPVIVSTMVQFLNILFSDKTSCIRRMQAVSQSVIVIDEIQTVPRKMLYMFNLALDFLSSFCHCTILLSSATQPVLDRAKYPLLLGNEADVIPYDPDLWKVFSRTKIIDCTSKTGMTLRELADFSEEKAEKKNSLLVVCNTKASALRLFSLIKEDEEAKGAACEVLYLSASMCMKHREDILSRINANLSEKKKMVCITTCIVEAGVDISFECAIRVKAGLDHVVQTAGRCNRNGESCELQEVYIVSLKEGEEKLTHLPEICQDQDCLGELLEIWEKDRERLDDDLLSAASVDTYYRILLREFETKSICEYLVPSLNDSLLNLLSVNKDRNNRSENSEHYIMFQAFSTAGKHFSVFDENTIDVIVPYQEGKEIISQMLAADVRFDFELLQKLVEKAKPYTIHIFKWQYEELHEEGMIYQDAQKKFSFLNEAVYSDETGLNADKEDDVTNYMT